MLIEQIKICEEKTCYPFMFECMDDSSIYYIFTEHAFWAKRCPRTMGEDRHSGNEVSLLSLTSWFIRACPDGPLYGLNRLVTIMGHLVNISKHAGSKTRYIP